MDGRAWGSVYRYSSCATDGEWIRSACFHLDVFEYGPLLLSPKVLPVTSVADIGILAGFIHLFFEAYFVVNHESLTGSQELFGQLWKEYSLSDSRYLISDAFLVCMEAVTAVSQE
jgi:hypothetical protein